MCAVSAVGDQYSIKQNWPDWPAQIPFPTPTSPPIKLPVQGPTRGEFEALKVQVEAMRAELEAARARDIADGAEDCEMEDKVAVLKNIAQLMGVDLGRVFPND